MDRNENLKQLKNLYVEMKNRKIPQFPDNERLSSCIESILELDPYYAGLALTVAEGGKISTKDLYDLEVLKKSLLSIKVDSNNDNKILDECKLYFKLLDKIDCLLRQLSLE